MQSPKLLDRAREVARFKHLSLRTETTYINCIRHFILYHGKRHPMDMGAEEIRQFLSYLAVEKHVAASTQNVALSALLFLYRDVLDMELQRHLARIKLAHEDDVRDGFGEVYLPYALERKYTGAGMGMAICVPGN